MKRIGLLILIGSILYSVNSLGQEIYKWVDEKGTVHFSDDLGQVPEKYRNHIQKRNLRKNLLLLNRFSFIH